MSDQLTLIIGRSYSYSMAWLRQNRKKYNLDPQRVRIVTRAEALKGLVNYRIIWLRGWNSMVGAQRIREAASAARSAGRVIEEIAD